MRINYCEGTIFAVPLRRSGFAVGVVARASSTGKVVICYFFGPRRTSIPLLSELATLNPSNSIRVLQVGDLSLVNGEWPIIGQLGPFNRCEWPMPSFVRKDELSHKAWRVQYSDKDPNKIEREDPVSFESKLQRDALHGAGAAELVLTGLLGDASAD